MSGYSTPQAPIAVTPNDFYLRLEVANTPVTIALQSASSTLSTLTLNEHQISVENGRILWSSANRSVSGPIWITGSAGTLSIGTGRQPGASSLLAEYTAPSVLSQTTRLTITGNATVATQSSVSSACLAAPLPAGQPWPIRQLPCVVRMEVVSLGDRTQACNPVQQTFVFGPYRLSISGSQGTLTGTGGTTSTQSIQSNLFRNYAYAYLRITSTNVTLGAGQDRTTNALAVWPLSNAAATVASIPSIQSLAIQENTSALALTIRQVTTDANADAIVRGVARAGSRASEPLPGNVSTSPYAWIGWTVLSIIVIVAVIAAIAYAVIEFQRGRDDEMLLYNRAAPAPPATQVINGCGATVPSTTNPRLGLSQWWRPVT